MGVTAYTLVRTDHRRIKKLVDKIGKMRFVKEVARVYGEYDMVVKTETESIKELTLFIYNQLRTIPGLTMTTTMITARINKNELSHLERFILSAHKKMNQRGRDDSFRAQAFQKL